MIEIVSTGEGGVKDVRRFTAPVLIGRDERATLLCANWRVGRRHASLAERSNTLWIQDLGSWTGTWVNNRRIVADTPLLEHDQVVIGPLHFSARWIPDSAASDAALLRANNVDAEHVLDMRLPQGATHGPVQGVAHNPRQASALGSSRSAAHGSTSCALAAATGSDSDVTDLLALNSQAHDIRRSPDAASTATATLDHNVTVVGETDVDLAPVRLRMHAMLLAALDLRREDVAGMSDQHLRVRARHILTTMLDADPTICPGVVRDATIDAVVDEAVGLGPLEPLLADDSVSEIMVNRFDQIYVERAGRLMPTSVVFANEASVLAVLDRIVAPLGRRIDESSPMVDARLPDGSRVNGVIGPITLKGATLTIRKFAKRRLTMSDLVENASLSANMAKFLGLCVLHKKNIVVSGGTGSGKTTLLNILSSLIGAHERVITIEDAAELQLPLAHVVAMEARPANVEGRGAVSIRDLVRNALRMRPDRIVVGECRGGEAFDMLAAMNTGHEGSLTTLHANTPRDALARLETMILMAGLQLPLTAVREHISSGIDIVVQQSRLNNGHRVLSDIAEVSGMDSGGIQIQSLFIRHKGRACFTGAGVLPSFTDQWRERGIELPGEWFDRTDSIPQDCLR